MRATRAIDIPAEASGTEAGAKPSNSVAGIATSKTARAILAAGVVAYVLVYATWSLRNYAGLATSGFDLGIHDQAVWLLSRGMNPFITISGNSYFGDHLYWIMLLFVPVYWIIPSAKVLLVAQSAALGLAAVPAFLLGREKLRSEWLAAGVALSYLLNCYLGWINLEQFHPDAFEVPLAFLAVLFAVRRKWVAFFVAVLLMLLVKEDVPLLVIGLGILVAVRYDRRIGIVTSLLAGAWLFINFRFLLPVLSGSGSLANYVSHHHERIPFGGLSGLLKTLFTRPWKVVSQAFSGHRPWYYLQVFAPVGFLPFLSPWTLLALAAPFVANGLSPILYQYQIEYHYGTLVVPCLIIAAVFGLARVTNIRLRRGLVGFMVVSAILCAWLWGPLPYSRHPGYSAKPTSYYTQAVDSAMELIPPQAVISVYYGYVSHLDHRPEVYEFPNPWVLSRWGDLKSDGQSLPALAARVSYVLVPRESLGASTSVFDRLVTSGEFRIAYDYGGVELLERVSPPPALGELAAPPLLATAKRTLP